MVFNNGEFRANRGLYPDTDYYGFKLRLRRYYYDSSVVREILGGPNHYRLPDNPKVVVDIGANTGLVSLLMARAGAEVYAFEPEVYNFETLCHNVEINGYKDRIHCQKEAVDVSGNVKLYVHPGASGTTSVYFEGAEGLEPDKYQIVPSLSIREVFSKYDIKHCNLLKLDCEGSEEKIINDIDDSLANKIDQISVEIHSWVAKSGLVEKLERWYSSECTQSRRGKNSIWVFRRRENE